MIDVDDAIYLGGNKLLADIVGKKWTNVVRRGKPNVRI